MPHSYISCNIHFIFSTKGRQNLIVQDVQDRLWPFIGGIARENGMVAQCIGGTGNHMHLLVSLPSTMSIAKAIQMIKGGSSKWANETFASARCFQWQEGYAAFAVSVSGLEKAAAYIRNQQEHHRTRTFEEEYIAFLKRHGIAYDHRYVFD